MKIKLSGVIITFNEEEKIRKCIESLEPVCDEILVVDSLSTDKTKSICEEKKVKFITNEFQGHIQQKNFAKHEAKYDYIISLDADEQLDKEAQKSILQIKNNWSESGYYFNRLNNYCGKWIKYGSWYPDLKLRLWDRRSGEWGGINPHDKFIINNNDKTRTLKGYILHYTADSKEQYLKQMKYFSEVAAKAYLKEIKNLLFSKY
jgi:glycosyltransferase involved in cell wall biosynthesis